MAKEKEELNLKGTKAEEKKPTTRKKVSEQKVEEKQTKKKTTQSASKSVAKKAEKESNSEAAKTKTAKTSKQTSSTKKETTSKASSTKKTATKKVATKTTKTTSSKTTNSSKKDKEKINKKVTPDTEKEKIKEETIIEKIKSFIAKIAAMQEEAKKENVGAKESKKTKKAKKKDDEIQTQSEYLPEYYDLPYRYNETVVKILAQTPKRIFVYWDVADEDRIKYQKAFGEDFFEKTYPVLLVHNEDKNYTTEIPINDFANSWYIDINDSKTKYTIQLGRKFKQIPTNIDTAKVAEQNIILRTDYLPIAQSNQLEVPNDRILFATLPRVIKFRNVKTYEEKEKLVSEIKTTYGNVYNIREFYKENYKEEVDEEIIGLNNPTSGGLSSSSFK